MIGYLEGTLLKKEEDRILLLTNQVGYEIMMPSFVMETIRNLQQGDFIKLYIYYHQSERQPKPILIGFNHELEKDFFQAFITVEDIGPVKAVKALNMPIHEIAAAVESENVKKLQQLKGIGTRTAQKVIAALKGRLGRFVLEKEQPTEKHSDVSVIVSEEIADQVLDVMVSQLGYKNAEAKRMITETLNRNPSISTPEKLLEEVIGLGH